MPTRKKPEAMTFEEALKRLEEIVGRLESGQQGLDEMLEAFEEGSELVRVCNRRLDEIEKRIEILIKKNGDDVPAALIPEAGAAEEPPDERHDEREVQ